MKPGRSAVKTPKTGPRARAELSSLALGWEKGKGGTGKGEDTHEDRTPDSPILAKLATSIQSVMI